MPGDPQILQDFTPVLRNVYLPFRKDAFPKLHPLLAQVRKAGPDRVRYGGNDLFFVVKVERRGGFTSSTRGFLPDSVIAREKQGRLSIARSYAVTSLDGLAIRATERDKDAAISTAKKAVGEVMDQWEVEQNRILHGDSLGVRAVIDSVTSTTVIVVDNPYGITDAGPGNLHLVAGETISVRDSTGATHRGKSVISTIALSGDLATLTLDTAITGMVAGDIVLTGPSTTTDSTDDSFGAEPHGVMSIVDVESAFATFEGINDSRWVAATLTSTTVDEMVVLRLLNTVRARAGIDWRSKPGQMLLITTTGIWQAYGESLLGLRRFSAPTLELEGGFTGVQVAGAALIDDPWAPRGRIYAIHAPSLLFIDLMDFGETSFRDAPEWQRSTTRDAYEAVFASYWNFGTTLRNAHGVISGITDTVNFSPVF